MDEERDTNLGVQSRADRLEDTSEEEDEDEGGDDQNSSSREHSDSPAKSARRGKTKDREVSNNIYRHVLEDVPYE